MFFLGQERRKRCGKMRKCTKQLYWGGGGLFLACFFLGKPQVRGGWFGSSRPQEPPGGLGQEKRGPFVGWVFLPILKKEHLELWAKLQRMM